MLYSLRKLKRIYGGRTVLDISRLDIEPEKIYTLIGPNGAGKTTLLNLLAFLENPDNGEISFNSSPVQFSDKKLRQLRRRVVLVDQYPILFTGPVWKNIEFGLKIRKIPKKKRISIVEEVLEMVGMQNFGDAEAHKLSGGETKRVALARALAIQPEVLLCDEPTANVDAENQEIILKILEKSNRDNKLSLIFATHYLSQAQRLADQTIVLQNGKLSGTAGENIFTAEKTDKNGDRFFWQIGGIHSLATSVIPSDQSSQKLKIFIDPKKINFVGENDFPEKVRNLWKGTICKIEMENGWVRITVDTGLRLDILVQQQIYRENPYHIGENVTLHITEEAVKL
jgi:tungstate transport system ATP-binding protein